MTPPNELSPDALRILVIDDDRELCGLIRDYLGPFGYEVTAEHDGRSGLNRARAEPFHALILDVMLPGLDGFEVLKQLRSDSDVPVLMLTSRGDETDRIVGLELGADDYLPKTFSSRELLARLRAVTRRSVNRPPAAAVAPTPATEEELVFDSLRIRPESRQAWLNHDTLQLTALEFDLLLSLARACGRVKTREQLLDTLAHRDYDGLDRSIDVHIWALRRKLGDDPKTPKFIKTVRSYGYMLIRPES